MDSTFFLTVMTTLGVALIAWISGKGIAFVISVL